MMQIKKLILDNNQEINLDSKNKNKQDKNLIYLLIGLNGTGKTRFLKKIYDSCFNNNKELEYSFTAKEQEIIQTIFDGKEEQFLFALREYQNFSINIPAQLPIPTQSIFRDEE